MGCWYQGMGEGGQSIVAGPGEERVADVAGVGVAADSAAAAAVVVVAAVVNQA